MMIATVVLMYAIIKLEHLLSKYNPNINDYYVDVATGEEANLNEKNFRIAFSIEDVYSPK